MSAQQARGWPSLGGYEIKCVCPPLGTFIAYMEQNVSTHCNDNKIEKKKSKRRANSKIGGIEKHKIGE